MKNRKSIFIVLLAVCLLCSAGCGKNEPQPTATTAENPDTSETAVSESGLAENQTAKGESVKTNAAETVSSVPETIWIEAPETHERSEKELKAFFGSIEDGREILDAYRSNEIAFSNEARLYGMNSETAALVTFKEGSFRCYVLKLKLKNTKKYDLTVHSVLSPDNGQNGVWVCGVSQYGTFDIAANSTAFMPVTVLADSSVTPGSAVEKALRSMKLTLEYTDLTDGVAEPNGEVGTVVVKM